MMDQSRDNATVAALLAAGVAVNPLTRVTSVSLSGPSANLLQPGDLITAVDGKPMSKPDDVVAQIGTHKVGEVVVFTVLRDRAEETISVTTVASNQDAQRAVVGIGMPDTGYQYSPRISYGVDANITGPSAGLVFALGVYDRISEQELIKGGVVAGTGTIDPSGRVGAIGAIREKIKGAERDDATIFLVPEGNCADAAGTDTELTLVKVGLLNDAIAALQLINEGKASEVPTCG